MANEPITRQEMLLNAVASGEAANLEPITREEMFLAKLGGADVNTPAPITRKEQFLMKAVEAMSGGNTGGGGSGGGSSVSKKDVNFYDYDGTLLHSYTVKEAKALAELPPLPEQPGLICQGWNWSLEDIKAHNRAVDVGATYTTDDGTTRIYIHLEEGRTSPMLGVCPNGTVTVDWGDGTEPDVLTGTSTTFVKRTQNHEYSEPGDYVIRLMVDGEMSFRGDSSGGYILRHISSSDSRNKVYQNAIQRVEIGNSVISIGSYAFSGCCSLASITIPNSVTSIADNVFQTCYSLASITIPNSVTSIADGAFMNCPSLTSVTIPDGVTSISSYAFGNCYSLTSVEIPDGVTSIGNNAFSGCYSLASITIPDGVTSIGNNAFSSCNSLTSTTIPDSVTSIDTYAFRNCPSLTSVTIPDGVTSIGSNAFNGCNGVRFYDFSKHTAVPTLSNTNAFTGIPVDCEIRVPAALYDEWIAATNWSTYASYNKAV